MTRKYKSSTLPFLAEIPETWSEEKLSHICSLKEIVNNKDEELLSVYLNKGVIRYSESDNTQVHKPSEDLSKYQLVEPGDLVLNNQQAWRGSVGVSKYRGIVSPAYFVFEFLKNHNVDFLNYLVRSKVMVNQFVIASKGVGSIQRQLYYPNLRNTLFLLPPLDEQKAIADFLDKKTEQIDRFISLQKEAISLLKELRQAEITKAVTKGLDENAEMKDSGVDGIGEIPKNWQISKVKYCYKVVNGSTPKSSNHEYWNGDIHWITPTDMANSDVIYSSERKITELGMNSCGTHLIPKNSLVLSTRAPIGHVCITGVELCTNQGCKSLVNEKTTDIKFHYYYLSSQTNELNKRGNGATFLELSTTSLENFPLIMPELHEQKEIVSYLDKKCAEIDSAIQNKEALIEKVTEYKTRLISDAVTGKIDVRGEDIKP